MPLSELLKTKAHASDAVFEGMREHDAEASARHVARIKRALERRRAREKAAV